MGRQTKSRNSDSATNKIANVTPIQVAFIVDRYLSDNNYAESRSVFRLEVSSLIAKSPIQEAPKSLLSLEAMLDEYICLKERKVILDQERIYLEQEKIRVHSLLQGMQTVMTAYNSTGRPLPPSISAAPDKVAALGHSDPSGCRAGVPINITQPVRSEATPTNGGPQGFTTPVINGMEANKRKRSKASTVVPPAAKRSRSKLSSRKSAGKDTDALSQSTEAGNVQSTVQLHNEMHSASPSCLPNESVVQGSSVVKCLFNQPSFSIPTNSSGPKTPPRANSCQSDKSTSPHEISSAADCSNNSTPQDVSPTCCTVISSKRVTISPYKQVAYYSVERNHSILSPSPVKTNLKRQGKREHVKGRLDFDVSDVPICSDKGIENEIYVSQSEKPWDAFDIDFPSLEIFGDDFSFTEILADLDVDSEVVGCSSVPTLGTSTDTLSSSSHESMDCNVGTNQMMSEYSSTVTQILSEKETNTEGIDSLTAVKSTTKCIRILSPAKKIVATQMGDQDNSAAS